jgi:pyrroloquinoline quinone biosynthesis protein D
MERLVVSEPTVLRLAPHIVFRFDDTRGRWVILAPERLMLPDDQAVEILQMVDGKASVEVIVDRLAAKYTQAPRGDIARDVAVMLQDLADKGCLADAAAR